MTFDRKVNDILGSEVNVLCFLKTDTWQVIETVIFWEVKKKQKQKQKTTAYWGIFQACNKEVLSQEFKNKRIN